MKPSLECIPCFINHSITVSRMASDDEGIHEKALKYTIARIAELDYSLPPPAMAKKIQGYVSKISGNKDPYINLKDQSTDFALKLHPFLKTEVQKADDQFECAVRLAIAGNIIDFGANHKFRFEEIHSVISDSLTEPLLLDKVVKMREKVKLAKSILYIADNAGELVFDRLLIDFFVEKTTLAIRGGPILNDVTRREAAMSGLVPGMKVIDTGDSVPGIILENSSDEFKDCFEKADLIIAKGQGNYETLDETDMPVFFLFKAKCQVVARNLGVKLGSLQIISKNIS